MNHLSEKHTKNNEKGSAGSKLLLVLVVIVLIANAGYHYIPTAYDGENFKQDMGTAVIQGITMPSTAGKPIDIVKRKLNNAAVSNNLPSDAYINVTEKNNVITARVFYVKKIPVLPFGIYEYDYIFDHSATPNGFLTE
ncbi:MAG: hypothetical protein ACR2J3_11570 [Aridibacter sp.]